MFKSFIPFAHANSIYEIDPKFFVKNGVKILFIDLDNTMDSYKAMHPKEPSVAYIRRLEASGITPVLVSNNTGKRVSSYANGLGIDYVWGAKKPFPCKLKKEMEKRNLAPDDVMLVGDQMMTDVLAAHNAHIRVVLTEKIVKEDQWTTHINRIFDRPIRKYHRKRGNLVSWEEK